MNLKQQIENAKIHPESSLAKSIEYAGYFLLTKDQFHTLLETAFKEKADICYNHAEIKCEEPGRKIRLQFLGKLIYWFNIKKESIVTSPDPETGLEQK